MIVEQRQVGGSTQMANGTAEPEPRKVAMSPTL
jgi:hypothetical protein